MTSRTIQQRSRCHIEHPVSDLLVSGVMVELDAGMAEDLGAFEETALSEADAWEANADLDAAEVDHGE